MIALLGYGFVGKAYFNVFSTKYSLTIIDPNFNDNQIEDIDDLRAAIICVPTPERSDGSCDIGIVKYVLNSIPKNIPILIKSTISLEGWREIKSIFPEHVITFSPEFLRADHANEDLKNLEYIYLADGNVNFWQEKFLDLYADLKVFVCNPEVAIAIKYFRNSFLATKCSFFNELYDFCKTLNINFEEVRAGVALDKRIGDSHTYVQEEKRGWGGFCFPKDTNALLKTAANSNINLNTLEAAVNYNKNLKKNID